MLPLATKPNQRLTAQEVAQLNAERMTRKLHQRAQEQRAIMLRKAGASVAQVAEQLKVSYSKASTIIKRALDRITDSYRGEAEQVRTLDLQRLESMWLKTWELMVDQAISPMERLAAVQTLLKLMEKQDALVGVKHLAPLGTRESYTDAERVWQVALDGATPEEAEKILSIVGAIRQRQTDVKQIASGPVDPDIAKAIDDVFKSPLHAEETPTGPGGTTGEGSAGEEAPVPLR